MTTKIGIDLKATDNASDSIKRVYAEIDKLRAKGKEQLTFADVRNLNKLSSQAGQLERAFDKVGASGQQAAKQISSSFGGIGDILGGLGLGSITGLVTGAGIAGLAVATGKAVIELGNLGQQVRQQRAYFEVWSGGVQKATENLDAMRRAVGNSMTDTEAMTGANKLLSMGLAKNAEDLEKFSRIAVMLGGSTRTASQAIDEFSLLLANQSILRLDTFGISGAKVRDRIEEMQAAMPGLSRETAFLNAVMEEGARKVDALTAAGVKATTATQDLGAAFRGLKEAIGEGINFDNVQRGIAGDIGTIGSWFKAQSDDVAVQLSGLNERLARTKERLNNLLADPQADYKFGESIKRAREEIAELEARIAYAKGTFTQWGDAGVGAALQVTNAMQTVPAAVGEINASLQSSMQWYGEWAGFAEAAAATFQASAFAAAQAMQSASGVSFDIIGPTRLEADTASGKRRLDAIKAEDELNKLKARNAETYAKSAATAYETAMKAATGRITGYLQQGMNASIGLMDVRGDIFKPGANGPFEDLFRTLDVAKLGGASPWAAVLGLTQEQAKKISADFQRGIFSEDVMGLVDVDALVNEAKLAEMAERTQAAFAEQIAKKAGVKTNLVANLFGYGGGGEGEKTGAVAQKQVDSAMQQVAASVGDTVKGKDFAGKIIGYGDAIWGYLERGIIDGAKESSALQTAIDAIVANVLARRGNASAQGAARSAGVTGV